MTYGSPVATPELEPVYLLTGTDLPKVELAVRRLRGRFDAGSIDRLAADTASAAEAVAATNALGLFGGGERLVVVDGVERWKKDDVAALTAYASSPTPGAVLALVGIPDKLPAGLEAVCQRAGRVLRYDIPTRPQRNREVPDHAKWVQQQFDAEGVQVGRDVADRLVELAGEDTLLLRNEIAKLVAWAAGGAIGTRDVEALVVPEIETGAWELVDSWGARDVAAALTACEAMLHDRDEPFSISARLASHIASVRAVHGLLEQDLGVREITQRLGMRNEFPVRKQAAQAARFTRRELSDALVRMADLDHRIKGGSRVSAVLELEHAIVDVTTGREIRPA